MVKKNSSIVNKTKYTDCVKHIESVKNAQLLCTEKRIIESRNLSKLYKHIYSRLTHTDGIAPLMNPDGDLVVNDIDKAEILNAHFVRVGRPDNGICPNMTPILQEGINICDVVFERESIVKKINELTINTSSGPDNIPSILLKNLSQELSRPMSIMFDMIFEFGHLPSEWKFAIVKPLFKKGVSSDPANYRPISLTCIICKIYENILKNDLLCYLCTNNLISKHQHGFLSRHSTTTNLLECLNDWTMNMDNKAPVKILYVDFAKAFDIVSVPKLIFKLRHYGIGGLMLKTIMSFLSDRYQKVKVGKCFSMNRKLISGVPQGSVLGPFLFLLFINDLPDIFVNNFQAKLFADDLKTYTKFDYRNDPPSVQLALDSIITWSKIWQLQLSVPKCGSLLLNTNCNFKDSCELFIDDNAFSELDTVVDLGVTIDRKLQLGQHITGIVSKSKKRTYLMFKSFLSRDIILLTFAFKIYILPILDYCSTVWNPCNLYDIDRLEKVQRYYTKRLYGLWNTPYSQRLIICSLTSLELRRLHADIILCFKIVHNLIDLAFNDFFSYDINSRTRGHNFKLVLPKFKSHTRQKIFSVRICPVWNALPSNLVNCSTLTLFKSELLKVNLSKFLVRNYDYLTT